jgi:hypothetical protein
MVSAAAAQGISQEEIEVRKGHRTRRAIGLALLFLLIASLLGLQLLTRRALGLPENQPGTSQLRTSEGNDKGPVSGPAGGAAGASTLAFAHDFDGIHSFGASDSRDDYSKIVGSQSGSETTRAGVGSGNLAGAGDSGPPGGSATSGSAGGGYGGAFWGGGGTGGSGGRGGFGGTGGPSGSSGAGSSSGAGGSGSPGGRIHETELSVTGTELGGGKGGDPSNTAPILTSVATIPGPPTIILVVAAVGMLRATTKFRRVRCR